MKGLLSSSNSWPFVVQSLPFYNVKGQLSLFMKNGSSKQETRGVSASALRAAEVQTEYNAHLGRYASYRLGGSAQCTMAMLP